MMDNAPDPAAMMEAVGRRRSALLAQCPAPPPLLTDDERADRPVNVIDHGAAGPVVIVVHGGVQGGLGGGPATFARQEALATRGWRLRMIERPGFGDSPSHGVDDMEADAALITRMLDGGAHLIGHSWGGAGALLAAAKRPEAVRSLTMIEPALFPLLGSDAAARADPSFGTVMGQMPRLFLASETPADYAVNFARSLLGEPGDHDPVAALEADRETAARFGCTVLQGRIAAPEVLRAAADTVAKADIPVLVVSGGWSPFFDLVGRSVARLTGGRFEIVPANGHMVQDVSADAFNTLVDAFMRGAEARQAG